MTALFASSALRKTTALLSALAVFFASIGAATIAYASSHREAPLISADPQADNTDVYAFLSPDAPTTATLIASFLPFEEPAGGPNFYKFGDDVLYALNVDNNGDAVADISYQYRFQTTIQNPNTFLYNTGPITSLTDTDFNMRQTYTLTRVENGVSTVLGTGLPVPPVNVGPKSTPNYADLSNAAIRTVGTNVKTFAGQTDDAFFVELGGLFDLLTVRTPPGDVGAGVDGLKGFNVQSIALQVPINQLTKDHLTPTGPTAANAVIGVWSTTSRPSVNVLRDNPLGPQTSGPFVQVSRLGAPLVNEVVLPLGQKDGWNNSKPADDAQYANYVTNPELATLLHAIYGITVPPQGPFGTANQRDDLIAIFLTGIPGLTQPPNVKPSEELRLNLAIAPNPNPQRLGVLAGDNQGYPNGRRLADDVTDISMRAVAGAAYPLFHPTFTVDPVGARLGDGVDANDAAFRCAFPYLALPWNGFDSRPHGTGGGAVTGPSCVNPGSSSSSSSTSTSSSSSSSSVASSSSSATSTSSASSVANVPTCNGLTATVYVKDGKVVGGNLNDQTYNGYLEGTPGADVIVGTDVTDSISGLEGDDVLCGRGGDDRLQGDQGADTLFGQDGNDSLGGSQGNDKISGGPGHDSVWGDGDQDLLCGNAGTNVLRGGDGNDTLDSGGQGIVDGENDSDICYGDFLVRCEAAVSGHAAECAALGQ